MINEPNMDTLHRVNPIVNLKAEMILLIFIVLFGLLGLALCMGLLDSQEENLSYLSEQYQYIEQQTLS